MSGDNHTAVPGDCPRCYSFDDDLAYRGGICETCFRAEQELSDGLAK